MMISLRTGERVTEGMAEGFPQPNRKGTRMVGLTCFVSAFFELLGATSASALDPRKAITQYRRDTWTLAHGLPHSSVNRIGQDSLGYLWLSTFGGAVRFDGVRFETVPLSIRPDEPTGASVADILEDTRGVLWFATGQGVFRVDPAGARLVTRKDGLPANGAQVLGLGPDDRLMVGTGRGLATLGFEPPFAPVPVPELHGSEVTSFLHDRGGRFWVGTRQGLRLREKSGRWEALTNAGGLETLHIWSVVEDPSGTIWIATRLGGLFSWTEGKVRRFTRREGLADDVVRSLLVDRQGSLWIGTSGGGVNRFRDGRFERLTAGDGGLPSDVVRSLFEDREGNIWIGTAGGGLTRLSDLPFVNLTTREGLVDDSVWTATEDLSGTLWVGSNGGLVGMRGSQVERHREAEGQQPSVLSLLATREGRLLVGTYRGLFELKGGQLVRLDRPGDLANVVVRSLIETSNGSVWIGTERGAVEFRPRDTPAFTTPGAALGSNVAVIRESKSGGLWLGLDPSGVVRFDKGVFTNQTWAEPLGAIRDLLEDSRGVLWIGGLGLGRYENGRLVRYGAAEGFAERRIHALLKDDLGNLWFSTNTGIYRVRISELDAFASGGPLKPRFEQFRESEGVPAAEGNGGSQPAAWRTRDGRLWFATIRGLAGVDPVAATKSDPPAVARIREALTDGGQVARGARLPLGVRRIEFGYTALRLTSPQQTRFRYLLEPVDASWSDAGSRRSVAYASLGPGTYRFRVAAAGRDELFHEDPSPFDFVVPPYFHERRSVRATAFVLLLGSLFAGSALRVRALRSREAELKRIVAEKTQELERLASEDPLTGLANRRQFDHELEKEILRSRRSSQPITLLMADVDNFKAYNDTYGHPQGDVCLRRIAAVLRDHGRRAGDLAARLGGEEFALLLPDLDAAQAASLAEALRLALSGQQIPHSGSASGYVSLSVGVATVPQEGADTLTPRHLVEAADAALYEAKAAGRNRVVTRVIGGGLAAVATPPKG